MERFSPMYSIAICDDDKKFITYIKTVLFQARQNEKQQFKIYEFSSGKELVWKLDGSVHFDLLILDMQLGEIDGDEVARIFRERFPYSVLVFCSGVRLPTIKSFKATPFRYLLKTQSNEELIHEMQEILAEVEKTLSESYIMGHYRSVSIKVRVRNILYIENSKRGSRVVVSPISEEAKFKGKILIDEKLGELAERFLKLGFAFPHSSYIVNLNHIESICSNDVKLDNGEILSI